MTNPLELSIQSAVKTNLYLGELHDRLGSKDHPDGLVTSAFSNARRAMTTAIIEPDPLNASRDVLKGLRQTVRTGSSELFRFAADYGQEEAIRQLEFYGVDVKPLPAGEITKGVANANKAVLAELDAEIAAIEAMILAGLDPTLILGDGEHGGMLLSNSLLLLITFWLTALLWDMFGKTSNKFSYDKQAVAVLDGRTTDCCLRVHGQIVPFDKPFILDGTPRYADALDWSPFHWRCRTSIVLYNQYFDNGFTERMTEGAKHVLDQRSNGIKWDQDPANAFID